MVTELFVLSIYNIIKSDVKKKKKKTILVKKIQIQNYKNFAF